MVIFNRKFFDNLSLSERMYLTKCINDYVQYNKKNSDDGFIQFLNQWLFKEEEVDAIGTVQRWLGEFQDFMADGEKEKIGLVDIATGYLKGMSSEEIHSKLSQYSGQLYNLAVEFYLLNKMESEQFIPFFDRALEHIDEADRYAACKGIETMDTIKSLWDFWKQNHD